MFQKDNRTELFLSREGVAFRYTNKCRVDKLKPGWELDNKGRAKPRKEDAIIEYAAKMEGGSPAPAVIVQEAPQGLEVLDGVQRLAAAQLCGCTMFSAYVVTTDSERTRIKIRIFANQILQGGHQESSAWVRRRAIEELIIQPQRVGDTPMSFEEIARPGGWTTAQVEQDYTLMVWRFEIRKIGGPGEDSGPNFLNVGVINHIAKTADIADIQKAPKPTAEFLHILAQCKFVNGDSNELSTQFFEKSRDKRRDLHTTLEARLEDIKNSPEVKTRLEGRGVQRQRGDLKLLAHMKKVETIAKQLIKQKPEIHYMEEYFQLWNRIEKHLKAIAKGNKTIA